MIKVTVEEIGNRLNRGEDVTVVDSRAPHVWDETDVKAGGAIRIPPDETEKHIADVSRDNYIVTYCTWPNEASSARAAQVLEEHGFENVHPLIGGFAAWQKANLPVEPK